MDQYPRFGYLHRIKGGFQLNVGSSLSYSVSIIVMSLYLYRGGLRGRNADLLASWLRFAVELVDVALRGRGGTVLPSTS
jgi:hypothetical protein